MTILGISDSHESHACIVRDGVLLAAMAEERLSRLKADIGYPKRSIEAILRMTGIDPTSIDLVAFAGARGQAFHRLYKYQALCSVRDWIRQCREFWKPKLFEGKPLTALDDFELMRGVRDPADLAADPYFPFLEQIRGRETREYDGIFNTLRRDVVAQHLGIDPKIVRFFRHEDCHKAYGYYSSPFHDASALVLTIEGGGDDSSATVSTMTPSGITEHWKSNAVHLGRLYRYVTLILGMKPAQHEYKVMGLAPYGTEYHGKRSLDFFRTINRVVGTEIHDTKTIPDLYYSVRDALEGERFDGMAWGLQTYLEEMLSAWVVNNVRAHGLGRVVLSGGVAQNIKACKVLLDLPAVQQFWVGPIAGDGSLAIGAAWLASRAAAPSVRIVGLESIYLGTAHDARAIDDAVARSGLTKRFEVAEQATAADVAAWIDRGSVVARFSGRMEFGQRALGNRSILADPRRTESVERINEKIKYRDFWMPFTPSMLAEDVDRFIENPKRVHSPHMTMAFDTKPEERHHIPAVIHPADKTARPQMLERQANPGYYDIISAFKERTGIGAVLNTSLNLHGDAIVESPDDAIQTFLKSDLDVLLFDHVAIGRVPLDRVRGAARAESALRPFAHTAPA
ncbi:MAG: carbamoyltransferase C-terminal domain-containing protein [bacterium]|nr:carbamoyltransferase C-terminal domain-containing protein [bacterium]